MDIKDLPFVLGTTSLSTKQRGYSDLIGIVHTRTPLVDDFSPDDIMVLTNSSETGQDEATSAERAGWLKAQKGGTSLGASKSHKRSHKRKRGGEEESSVRQQVRSAGLA